MPDFSTWCGFFGAWFLVAGPVYQAVLELREQDVRRDEIVAVSAAIPSPPPVSAWWWLLPPVHYWLRRRRAMAARDAVMNELDADHVASLVQFINKATGWLYVALGGLLIATKETWELHEHYEWPLAVFWLLAVLMLVVCLTNTAVLIRRGERELDRRKARSHPSRRPGRATNRSTAAPAPRNSLDP